MMGGGKGGLGGCLGCLAQLAGCLGTRQQPSERAAGPSGRPRCGVHSAPLAMDLTAAPNRHKLASDRTCASRSSFHPPPAGWRPGRGEPQEMGRDSRDNRAGML